jgi:hypothetical protein
MDQVSADALNKIDSKLIELDEVLMSASDILMSDKLKISNQIVDLLKYRFSLVALIKLKNCIEILSTHKKWNINLILNYTSNPSLIISIINLPNIYFSMTCPKDLLSSDNNGEVSSRDKILAECMIVDDDRDKYYDRLDFELDNESHNENTFYIYKYIEVRKILEKIMM